MFRLCHWAPDYGVGRSELLLLIQAHCLIHVVGSRFGFCAVVGNVCCPSWFNRKHLHSEVVQERNHCLWLWVHKTVERETFREAEHKKNPRPIQLRLQEFKFKHGSFIDSFAPFARGVPCLFCLLSCLILTCIFWPVLLWQGSSTVVRSQVINSARDSKHVQLKRPTHYQGVFEELRKKGLNCDVEHFSTLTRNSNVSKRTEFGSLYLLFSYYGVCVCISV